jgi:hypothetical protein
MTQQLAAMLGTLVIQDADVGSRSPTTYLNTCNYSRAALGYLDWGKFCLQGPELSGRDTHRSLQPA